MTDLVILGAGLAGLSAAHYLQSIPRIYDQNSEAGGLCRSVRRGGFIFDYGPHILFPKAEDIAELIRTLLAGNLRIQGREAWIFHRFCEIYTRFPFQAHLHGLPVSVVKDCVMGLFHVLADRGPRPGPRNYRDWMMTTFGKGITEHLMIPYAEKLWTVDPALMNFEWVKNRIPQPDLEDVLDGALSDNPKKFGFNTEFWYPLKGGIAALPQAFLPSTGEVHLNKTVVRIDPKKKTVEFSDSERISYEKMIFTLPLPEVAALCPEAPDDVKAAARDLEHNSILCVNLGVRRNSVSDKHWIYFYEDEFCFHRISFPGNFSPHTVPPDASSISTEIAHSRHRSIDKANIVERVRDDLILAGILEPDDEILVSDVLDIKYGYIIYDLNHRKNVSRIHSYLRDNDIRPCGRFGEWEYFNMDHSLDSGRRTALEINLSR